MPAPRSRCGVLLAGGASARFGGTPKGLEPCGAQRLADFALHALDATCERVVIASNALEAGAWFPGHDVIGDIRPGLGALSALGTALRAANGDVVVVCAWDMPFVSPALLESLAQAVESGAPCCVPVHPDGRLEPLCAAYAPACETVALSLLDAGERAAHALAQRVGGARWPIAPRSPGSDVPDQFFNVNTASDLAYAATWFTSHPISR